MQACLSTAGTAANLPQCLINTLQSVFCDGNWSSHLGKCTKRQRWVHKKGDSLNHGESVWKVGRLATEDYPASECGYCVKATNSQFEVKFKRKKSFNYKVAAVHSKCYDKAFSKINDDSGIYYCFSVWKTCLYNLWLYNGKAGVWIVIFWSEICMLMGGGIYMYPVFFPLLTWQAIIDVLKVVNHQFFWHL